MVPFCKLADPARYVACSLDLTSEPIARQHWVDFFKRHLNTILKSGVEAAVARGEPHAHAQRRADACRDDYCSHFDAYAADPAPFGTVTILILDQWRDDFLRRHGFVDPFIDLKNRENQKVLPMLPAVCRQLDQLSGRAQLDAVILGVFAGNIFDMGAEATALAFTAGSPDFFTTRHTITPRPWLIDDYDCLADRMLNGLSHRKAVFFIDNAGSDFILGAVPMIRWLAQRGTSVIVAANDRPCLNDMTIHDVRGWWPRILQAEPSLAGLPIEMVNTGTGEPLIDLAQISPQLNTASADADLVILEGMGRAVESNIDAIFACEALHLAMIKDGDIAQRHAGKIFDVVCRFRSPCG